MGRFQTEKRYGSQFRHTESKRKVKRQIEDAKRRAELEKERLELAKLKAERRKQFLEPARSYYSEAYKHTKAITRKPRKKTTRRKKGKRRRRRVAPKRQIAPKRQPTYYNPFATQF